MLRKKILLGGGTHKKAGYINIDILNLPEVDIVHDLSQGIPLEDNSVEEIVANHILEHLPDTLSIMKEMYRVCIDGAIIKIKVPYFKSIGAFKDPTHKSFFTEKTFDYFDSERMQNLPNYQISFDFRIEHTGYIWSQKWIRFLPFKKSVFLPYFWNIARTMHITLMVVKK